MKTLQQVVAEKFGEDVKIKDGIKIIRILKEYKREPYNFPIKGCDLINNLGDSLQNAIGTEFKIEPNAADPSEDCIVLVSYLTDHGDRTYPFMVEFAYKDDFILIEQIAVRPETFGKQSRGAKNVMATQVTTTKYSRNNAPSKISWDTALRNFNKKESDLYAIPGEYFDKFMNALIKA
jgi:hypothetical protein